MESWGIQRLVFVDTDPLIFEQEMDPVPHKNKKAVYGSV